MAELKTQQTDEDVGAFIDAVEHDVRRADARAALALMQELTGAPPRMWGKSIVGFGRTRYRYESGREADWFLVGFSPRKAALTLYIMDGFSRYDELMARLGKHKTGKSCLYIKRWSDIDEGVLRQLIEESLAHLEAKYG